MRTIDHVSATAIILARGGSKGIPKKNLQLIGNQTLIARTILECKRVNSIKTIYVSTDSAEISIESEKHGALVLERTREMASDQISSEASLLEVVSQIQSKDYPLSEIILFAQCTSPFTQAQELQKAIEEFESNPRGTLFSATRTHDFHWELVDGLAIPISEGTLPRKRRQDLKPRFAESGAFYIFNLNEFKKSRSRFNEPIRIFESSKLTSMEIDTNEDLIIARQLSPLNKVYTHTDTIKAVVTDFDGVLTDNHSYVNQDGTESVKVSRGDGLGIRLLKEKGIKVLILSSENNSVVRRRAEKLNVECIQSSLEKEISLTEWCKKNEISLNQVCYLGNDVNDLSVMKIVGLSVAVADSAIEILEMSKIILEAKGGNHAIRELARLILDSELEKNGGKN
jgi:YrbI family 3-deoxy-D-manno-octulosonate 8-phosphate phosphatase